MKEMTYEKKERVFELTSEDILKMFYLYNDIPDEDEGKVFLVCPGGGDWSGMNINIGEDAPLKIVVKSERTY